MNIAKIARWCMRIGFALLFILVPLILTPYNYELFEYNKMMVTYALGVFILGSWIIGMIAEKRFQLYRTPLDIPLWLFVLSQTISTIFSIDPHVSWIGYYSRFNGGLWSILMYALLYHAFIGMMHEFIPNNKHTPITFNSHRLIIIALQIIVGTSVIVAIYGVLERLGIDKQIWVQDVQSRVFSTLGQPNWLAAYLVAVFPISVAFAIRGIERVKSGIQFRLPFLGWTAVSILLFTTLLFTRSRSGLLAFAVSNAIFWGLLLIKSAHKKSIIFSFLIINSILVAVIYVNGSNISQIDKYFSLNSMLSRLNRPTNQTEQKPAAPAPAPSGTSIEFGGTESGTIRKFVWETALIAWRSTTKTFFIGTGTETFAFAFFKFKPLGHNLTSEWDFLYNKAHNEYLNYLATTGLIGLGTYLGFIAIGKIWFLNYILRHRQTDMEKAATTPAHTDEKTMTSLHTDVMLSIALFAGWISILITNFFGFSVVIIQVFLFLYPAMFWALTTAQSSRRERFHFSPHMSTNLQYLTGGIVSIVTVTLLVFLSAIWYADKAFATGYHTARAGSYAAALPYLQTAVGINPQEPMYHEEISTTLASLAVVALEQKNATLASDLARQSLNHSDISLTISPQNVSFWKSRTKILYTFSTFDAQYNSLAIQTLEKAFALSPTDPRIAYNLAVLYGRQGDTKKAIELLKQSKVLKPNYRDPYNALYLFYTELKQTQDAKAIANEYVTKVDSNDKEFIDRLK